eukprot:gene12880-biopygen21519
MVVRALRFQRMDSGTCNESITGRVRAVQVGYWPAFGPLLDAECHFSHSAFQRPRMGALFLHPTTKEGEGAEFIYKNKKYHNDRGRLLPQAGLYQRPVMGPEKSLALRAGMRTSDERLLLRTRGRPAERGSDVREFRGLSGRHAEKIHGGIFVGSGTRTDAQSMAQPAGQGWTGQNRQDSIGQEGVELDRTGQEGVELWTEQTARQDEAGLKAPPPTPFLPARLSRKALCGALAISNRELSSARSTRFRDKEGRQNMDLQSSMMASSAAPKKQCPRGRLGSRANTPKWGRGSTGSSTRKARGSGEWGRLDPPPPCINHYSEFGKISF